MKDLDSLRCAPAVVLLVLQLDHGLLDAPFDHCVHVEERRLEKTGGELLARHYFALIRLGTLVPGYHLLQNLAQRAPRSVPISPSQQTLVNPVLRAQSAADVPR